MRLIVFLLYYSGLLVATTLRVSAQVREAAPEPATLAHYFWSLDWQSLGTAMLISLVGGAGRTAWSLFSPVAAVRSALRETLKDAIVAAVTGVVCFMVILVLSARWVPPLPLQVGFIFFAGFTRSLFIGKLDRWSEWLLDLAARRAVGYLEARRSAAQAQERELP